jgi:hypothetical protein
VRSAYSFANHRHEKFARPARTCQGRTGDGVQANTERKFMTSSFATSRGQTADKTESNFESVDPCTPNLTAFRSAGLPPKGRWTHPARILW